MNVNFDSLLRMCDMQWQCEARFWKIAFYGGIALVNAGCHSKCLKYISLYIDPLQEIQTCTSPTSKSKVLLL